MSLVFLPGCLDFLVVFDCNYVQSRVNRTSQEIGWEDHVQTCNVSSATLNPTQQNSSQEMIRGHVGSTHILLPLNPSRFNPTGHYLHITWTASRC